MNYSLSSTSYPLDLLKAVDDILLILSVKEREVVVRRFGIDGSERQTLEQIGQKFKVTRERIRQIEKVALVKLRRVMPGSSLKPVSELAIFSLNRKGGICIETKLISEILKGLNRQEMGDGNILRLVLAVSPEVKRVSQNDLCEAYYHLKNILSRDIEAVCAKSTTVLERYKNFVSPAKLLSDLSLLFAAEDMTFPADFILSSIETDRRFKIAPEGYGLMSWRHINPRSIRDKIWIILTRNKKPLHFSELAKRIEEAKFDHKRVTIQAVHNELIREEQFVLVGRGLYGLKSWGYKEGTVTDVIEDVLSKKSPLSKQAIMEAVLKERFVKKGTISLCLQKAPYFVRVDRAMYKLDLSRKPVGA